jgi:hypothetical protein
VTWLAWRQFRANAALAAATTVAVVVVLVITRDHIAQVGDPGALSSAYKSLQLLGTVLIGVPAFIGAFWGAPLLARELETGTHRLAWTQSVTRARWLGTKLAVAGLMAVIVTGVFSLLFTWWSLPLDRFGNRIGTANFGQRGIVPVAYAVFALVLGTLLGAMLRRTLPAMAATLFGFFVVRFSFQLLVRPHLLDPVTTSLPNNLFGQRDGLSAGAGGWIMSTRTVDAAGHALSSAQIDRMLVDACHLTRDSSRAEWIRCADRLGLHDVVRMHPADQFWPLQGWEAASFLALAGVLAFICFWWIRHRTS